MRRFFGRFGQPTERFFHESFRAQRSGAIVARRNSLLRQMRAAKRNRNDKFRAAPNFAFDANLSSVHLDEFANKREADATAFDGPALRAFNAMEALENIG